MTQQAMEKIVEDLRQELDKNYQAKFEVQAAKYAVLEKAYLEMINALHHELSGSICTIEGLFNLQKIEGNKMNYSAELMAEFEKVRIKRERIQKSYIDTTMPIRQEIIYQNLQKDDSNFQITR